MTNQKLKFIAGKFLILLGSYFIASAISIMMDIWGWNHVPDFMEKIYSIPTVYKLFILCLPMLAIIFYFSQRWLQEKPEKRRVYFGVVAVAGFILMMAASDVQPPRMREYFQKIRSVSNHTIVVDKKRDR